MRYRRIVDTSHFHMSFIRSILVFLLTFEARLALARHKPRIIAVTGSVGKTSTKDAIYAAISGELYVRKNRKSFNSDIGVPLTILGLDNPWSNPFKWIVVLVRGLIVVFISRDYPAWLVVEVGADRPGDIRSIAQWLRPHVVVYTGVPDVPVHVEYFAGPEEVYKEKRSLVEHIRDGGALVVNADDAHTDDLRAHCGGTVPACGLIVSYGIERHADFFASHEDIMTQHGVPAGIRFRVQHAGSSVPMALLGALGRPRAYAALAALAAGKAVGVDVVSASRALAQWSPPPGRMRLIEGVESSVIIDDTYNSSPAAVHAALDTLKKIRTSGRKIAILGDMLELGKFSANEHRAVGEQAAKSATMLITIGFRARGMGEAALDAGMSGENVRAYEHDEAVRAGDELRLELKAGDVVLVKGSQSMRMERTVKALMLHPEKAENLLVRQDTQWRVR